MYWWWRVRWIGLFWIGSLVWVIFSVVFWKFLCIRTTTPKIAISKSLDYAGFTISRLQWLQVWGKKVHKSTKKYGKVLSVLVSHRGQIPPNVKICAKVAGWNP